jgi:multidrug efflux pump subunit AcrB
VIAVLAFAAIGTSQDSTGEYTRSLYTVILISLMLSWVTAITVTPLLGVMFLRVKPPKPGEAEKDPYSGKFYSGFNSFLRGTIRYRWVTVGVVVAVFAASLFGFGYVEQSFFPNSTRPQMMVDYWLPQGTHIRDTESDVKEIESWLLEQEGVTNVASSIGAGTLRFLLTYKPIHMGSHRLASSSSVRVSRARSRPGSSDRTPTRSVRSRGWPSPSWRGSRICTGYARTGGSASRSYVPSWPRRRPT